MIHPSGIQTTDYEAGERYEPTPWQIANAARLPDGYTSRFRPKPFPWWAVFLIASCTFGLVKLFISIL